MTSYTYTCYLLDVSPSMAEPLDASVSDRSRLSYALEFVRIKLAQRLYNPKATDQIAVVLFGGKTNNALQDQDGYDNIEELIQMRQPSYDDFRKLDTISPGSTDTDIISALYVAGNLVRNAVVRRKDSKKQIILITDADQPLGKDEDGNDVPCTDWDNQDWVNPLYGSIIPGLVGSSVLDWKMLFTLGIIGTDFGEVELESENSSQWSEEKRRNVKGLRSMYEHINKETESRYPQYVPRAILGSVLPAIEGAAQPSVAPIATTKKRVDLIIGDADAFPDSSVKFSVYVQKATQKASAKSMQKMQRGKWKKELGRPAAENGSGSKKRRVPSDEAEDEDEDDDEDRTTLHQPGTLITEKHWYYVPNFAKDDSAANKPDKGKGKAREGSDDEDSDDENERYKNSEAARRLQTDENLSRAYKYGADLLPISKEDEQDFYRFPAGEPCMLVRGFRKAEDYHPEWALGDPYWVFGGDDNRAQLHFSSLLWAMTDAGLHGVVRLLLPGQTAQPQPRICLLIPRVGPAEELVEGLELALLVPMPFKEELANWAFPSLDRILTQSGRVIEEHRLLPKKDLLDAMDDFVDSMRLPGYTPGAEESGVKKEELTQANDQSDEYDIPWFDPNQSFNPGIHNFRNCIVHKLLHPSSDISKPDDPHPFNIHPMVTQYLYPPEEVMASSSKAASALAEAARLSLIPPKPKFARGKGAKTKAARKNKGNAVADLFGTAGQDALRDDEDEIDVAQQESQAVFGHSQNLYRSSAYASISKQSQSRSMQERSSAAPAADTSTSQNGRGKGKATTKKKMHNGTDEEDGSATEESDADETNESGSMQLDAPAQPERQSLISLETPIEDFEKLVEQGGHMTSTAFKQFLEYVLELLQLAEKDRRGVDPLECVRVVRKSALEEDEAVEYNGFVHKLKAQKGKSGPLLKQLKKEKLGLITVEEGLRMPGEPPLDGSVEVDEAEKFWED